MRTLRDRRTDRRTSEGGDILPQLGQLTMITTMNMTANNETSLNDHDEMIAECISFIEMYRSPNIHSSFWLFLGRFLQKWLNF